MSLAGVLARCRPTAAVPPPTSAAMPTPARTRRSDGRRSETMPTRFDTGRRIPGEERVECDVIPLAEAVARGITSHSTCGGRGSAVGGGEAVAQCGDFDLDGRGEAAGLRPGDRDQRVGRRLVDLPGRGDDLCRLRACGSRGRAGPERCVDGPGGGTQLPDDRAEVTSRRTG